MELPSRYSREYGSFVVEEDLVKTGRCLDEAMKLRGGVGVKQDLSLDFGFK